MNHIRRISQNIRSVTELSYLGYNKEVISKGYLERGDYIGNKRTTTTIKSQTNLMLKTFIVSKATGLNRMTINSVLFIINLLLIIIKLTLSL